MADTPATRLNGAALTSLVTCPVPSGAGGLWWDGNATGPKWRKADGSDVTLGSSASLGNFTFSTNAQDLSVGSTMTIGGTTATGVTVGRTNGTTTINSGTVTLRGGVADGASAIAAVATSVNTLANGTSRIFSFQNATTEKLGVLFNGSLLGTDGTSTLGDATHRWASMNLASGATITASGSMTATATTGTLTLTGNTDRSFKIDSVTDGFAWIFGGGGEYLRLTSTALVAANGVATLGSAATPWPSSFTSRPVITNQVIAAASSITVNPASGDYVRINLSATAITSLTISAGNNGEELVVEVIEDATGTRTIPSTWTNVAFAGGSYTRTATANARDVISFVYNSTLAKWVETGRALAVT